MLVITHALIPVSIAATVNVVDSRSARVQTFAWPDLALIAVCGALPDFLSPHAGIEARHASWSHTAWFALGVAPLLLIVARWLRRPCWLATALMCWLAVALHIACDGISGGVALWYPRPGVWGDYYVSPVWWIPLDIVMVVVTLLLLGRAHRLGRAGERVDADGLASKVDPYLSRRMAGGVRRALRATFPPHPASLPPASEAIVSPSPNDLSPPRNPVD